MKYIRNHIAIYLADMITLFQQSFPLTPHAPD
jgi:hypothetical protein